MFSSNNRKREMRAIILRVEKIVSLVLFMVGSVLIVIALGADYIGVDITPGFGMVQMAQLLAGFTLLVVSSFMRVHILRFGKTPRSLQADIGIRLGLSGLVFTYVSGLADLIGIGTHVEPSFDRPYVGPIQTGGLILGAAIIAVGLMLYYTSRGTRETSSLESLLPNRS